MKNKNRKSFTLIATLLLLVFVAVGGTAAFLIAQSSSVTNTFIPTEITSTVTEDFDGKAKEDVRIKNTSKDVSAYIRAAVVINWKNNNNEIKPAMAGDYEIEFSSDADWKKVGDYYYYTELVAPGAETDVLIESCVPLVDKSEEGYYLDVVILGSAIQSEPADAIEEAWGIDPDTWEPTTSN